MDILEQREQWSADFDRECPEEMTDRLRWFTDRLGIRPYHLLRLVGLSRQEAEELAKAPVDWDAVIASYSEESVWWAAGRVMSLLRDARWNWRAVRDQLHQPTGRPLRVLRPGGWEISPYELPPEERETVLLTLIAAGYGSSSYLLAYLCAPTATGAPS